MRAHMHSLRRASKHTPPTQRKGIVVILTAILLVLLVAMIAFSVDLGYMYSVRTQLDRAVDAGALAGAGTLVDGRVQAEQAVYDFIGMNLVGKQAVSPGDVVIETGLWDANSRSFQASGDTPSAIRVVARRQRELLFFAPVLGFDDFDVESEAIAVYQPRDIMLVLDYSASMNDDSELRHISTIGQAAVEANLLQIYQELGAPVFGAMQWNPTYIASDDTSVVKSQLGLTNVPYPFPSGSWNDYIYYVRTSGYVSRAGYRKRYGYLTLTNYWLERRPMHSQTPTLWQTSEQPITAVKNAVTVFLAYLQEVETDDRLGLAVYTSSNDTALLEQGLTPNFQQVEDISRQRQAGHYDRMTNIGAGIQTARLEMENNARPGAFKMIVLMTDGIANLPTDSATARQFALTEAQRCADDGYPIVTISLGSGADTSLMGQIASITGGVHFNVPGGQSVAAYEQDLKDVFRDVAADRPLKLVK